MKCLIHMIFGFEIFTEVCTIKLIFIIDRIIKNRKNFNHYERDAIINIIYIYIYIKRIYWCSQRTSNVQTTTSTATTNNT